MGERKCRVVRIDITILDDLISHAKEYHLTDERQEFKLDRYGKAPPQDAVVEKALLIFIRSRTKPVSK